jgi:hypothetical protein
VLDLVRACPSANRFCMAKTVLSVTVMCALRGICIRVKSPQSFGIFEKFFGISPGISLAIDESFSAAIFAASVSSAAHEAGPSRPQRAAAAKHARARRCARRSKLHRRARSGGVAQAARTRGTRWPPVRHRRATRRALQRAQHTTGGSAARSSCLPIASSAERRLPCARGSGLHLGGRGSRQKVRTTFSEG